MSSLLSVVVMATALPWAGDGVGTEPATLLAPRPLPASSESAGLEPFRVVRVAGDIALNVHGDAPEVSTAVDCPTQQGPGIQLRVEEDTLQVTPMHEGLRTSGRCTLTLRAPGVEQIELAGASRLRGGAMAQLSVVRVGGAANVDLRGLGAPAFSLEVSGAGKVRLAGAVDSLQVRVAGAANVDAKSLTTGSARLTTEGTGNIVSTVTRQVVAHSHGAGTITLLGAPEQVEESTAGLGKVVRK